MVKMFLKMAMDFRARKNVQRGRYTYQHQGKWWLCSYGPKYTNIFEITEYTEEDLVLMRQMEKKDEPKEDT